MIIQNVFVKGIHVKTNQESDAAYTDIGTKWKRNRSMNREDGGSIMRKSIKKVLALGIAAQDIKAGAHVHTHNVESHRENL